MILQQYRECRKVCLLYVTIFSNVLDPEGSSAVCGRSSHGDCYEMSAGSGEVNPSTTLSGYPVDLNRRILSQIVIQDFYCPSLQNMVRMVDCSLLS